MKQLSTRFKFVILILLFALVMPVVAQDSTPTAEAAQSANEADEPVDPLVEFIFNVLQGIFAYASENNLQWLLLIMAFIWLPPGWVVDAAGGLATRTSTPRDDQLVDFWRRLRELNPANDLIDNTRQPPIDAPPTVERGHIVGEQINPVHDLANLGFYPDDKSGRAIAVPKGYQLYAQVGDTNTFAEMFWDEGQGYKIMLDDRGRLSDIGKPAQFGYQLAGTLRLQGGKRYSVACIFDAMITGGAANIKGDILLDGVVIAALHPQRIEGVYAQESVVWALAALDSMNVSFRLYVEPEYTLKGNSFVRLRELPLEVQPASYGGNDAITLKKS